MSSFLEICQTILLAFIAFELFVLRREIPRFGIDRIRERDDSHVKGQTINVNVGTPLVSESFPAAASPEAAARAEETKQQPEPAPAAEIPEIPEPPPRPAERTAAVVRQASNGVLVKKCPKCGMENSSYRDVCFNCGSAL